MGCKLKNTIIKGTIQMKDLPAGKIAVVVSDCADVGTLVQRNVGALVQRGDKKTSGFIVLGSQDGDRSNHFLSNCDLAVYVLKKGEEIVVEYD